MSSAYIASKNDESHHLNLNASQRFDYLTKVYWDWAAYLRPSETVLLGWIMSNTIGRDKRSGYYSLNHLVKGVGKRNIGDKRTGGTGLSRKTIQRATESLEKRGVITTYIHRKGKVFTIVLDWDPTTSQDGGSNVVPLRPHQTSRQASQQDDDDDY